MWEKTPHAHIDSAHREESFAPIFSTNGPQGCELWRVKVGGGWVGVLDPLRQDTHRLIFALSEYKTLVWPGIVTLISLMHILQQSQAQGRRNRGITVSFDVGLRVCLRMGCGLVRSFSSCQYCLKLY